MPIHFMPRSRKSRHAGPDLRIVRYNQGPSSRGKHSIQVDVFASPRFCKDNEWALGDGDRVTLMAGDDGSWKVIKAKDECGYVVRQKVMRGRKTPFFRVGMSKREVREVFGDLRELNLVHVASKGDAALFARSIDHVRQEDSHAIDCY